MEAHMIDTEDIVHYEDAMETERDDDGDYDIDLVGNSEQHHFDISEDVEIIDYEEDGRYENDEEMIVDMRTPQPADIDIPIDDRDQYTNSINMEIQQVSTEETMASPNEHLTTQPSDQQSSHRFQDLKSSHNESESHITVPPPSQPPVSQSTEPIQNAPAHTSSSNEPSQASEPAAPAAATDQKNKDSELPNQSEEISDQRSRASSATLGNEAPAVAEAEIVPEASSAESPKETAESTARNSATEPVTEPDLNTEPTAENAPEVEAVSNKIQPVMIWWEERELSLYNKDYYLSPQEVDPTLSPEEVEYPVEFLFPDISLHEKGLDQVFTELRSLFGTDEDDELTIFVEDLNLTFREDNSLTQHFNLADIQRLFERFEKSEPKFLTLYLQTEPRITKLFSELLTAAAENRRLEDVQASHDGYDSDESEGLRTSEGKSQVQEIVQKTTEETTLTTESGQAEIVHHEERTETIEQHYEEEMYGGQDQADADHANASNEGTTNQEAHAPQEEQHEHMQQYDEAEEKIGKTNTTTEREKPNEYSANNDDGDDQGEISELDDRDIVDLAEPEEKQDTYNESENDPHTADHTTNHSPATEEGYDGQDGQEYEEREDQGEEYADEYAEEYDEEYAEEYPGEEDQEHENQQFAETTEEYTEEHHEEYHEELHAIPQNDTNDEENAEAHDVLQEDNDGELVGERVDGQGDEELYEFDDQDQDATADPAVDGDYDNAAAAEENQKQTGREKLLDDSGLADHANEDTDNVEPITAETYPTPQEGEGVIYAEFEFEAEEIGAEEGEDPYYEEEQENVGKVAISHEDDNAPERPIAVDVSGVNAQTEVEDFVGEVADVETADSLAEKTMEEFSAEVTEEDFELLYSGQGETMMEGEEGLQDQRQSDGKRMREDDGMDGEDVQPKALKRKKSE